MKAIAAALVGMTALGAGSVDAASAPLDPAADFVAALAAQGVEASYIACTTTDTGGAVCYGTQSADGGGTATVWVGVSGAPEDNVYFFIASSFTPAGDNAAPAVGLPAGAASTITDGTWIVGTDVAPGTYRAVVPEGDILTMCSWQRLSGLSGESDDIITIDLSTTPGAQVLVEIATTDVAFETSGCGTWEPLP